LALALEPSAKQEPAGRRDRLALRCWPWSLVHPSEPLAASDASFEGYLIPNETPPWMITI